MAKVNETCQECSLHEERKSLLAELWSPWQPKGNFLKISLSKTTRARAMNFGL
jgi:hypothetical protein